MPVVVQPALGRVDQREGVFVAGPDDAGRRPGSDLQVDVAVAPLADRQRADQLRHAGRVFLAGLVGREADRRVAEERF